MEANLERYQAIQEVQIAINKCKDMFNNTNIFKFSKDEEFKASYLCSEIFKIGKIEILKGIHGFDFCTRNRFKGEIKSSRQKKYKTREGYPRGAYEFDKRHMRDKVEKTKEIDAFMFSKIDDESGNVVQLIYIEKPSAVKKVHNIIKKKQKEFEELCKIKNVSRQSIWIYDKDIIGNFNPNEYYLANVDDLLPYNILI